MNAGHRSYTPSCACIGAMQVTPSPPPVDRAVLSAENCPLGRDDEGPGPAELQRVHACGDSNLYLHHHHGDQLTLSERRTAIAFEHFTTAAITAVALQSASGLVVVA